MNSSRKKQLIKKKYSKGFQKHLQEETSKNPKHFYKNFPKDINKNYNKIPQKQEEGSGAFEAGRRMKTDVCGYRQKQKSSSANFEMPVLHTYIARPIPEEFSHTNNDYCDEEELVIDPINIKHYLQNSWTFWYLETDHNKSWEDMLLEISTVKTVEDFWHMYSHFKPPSQLAIGCDYSFFKKGIRPMWEDPANRDGGRWVITFFKNCKGDLDSIWLDVMLCLIGETLQNSNEICGAVVNIRGKNNKISVWTSNSSNEKSVLEIGWRLRQSLRLRPHNLKYVIHKDFMYILEGGIQSVYIL